MAGSGNSCFIFRLGIVKKSPYFTRFSASTINSKYNMLRRYRFTCFSNSCPKPQTGSEENPRSIYVFPAPPIKAGRDAKPIHRKPLRESPYPFSIFPTPPIKAALITN